ncbi:hypothetical protein TNCV_1760541 [Trichonephila clavipes]|nr:hypothetical protein TNCV_1760541 [Trichonephila clavipes]
MIPFIKRFSYLHLKNLDDLQPDETEVKSIVPSPRYNLRARTVGGIGWFVRSVDISSSVVELCSNLQVEQSFAQFFSWLLMR